MRTRKIVKKSKRIKEIKKEVSRISKKIWWKMQRQLHKPPKDNENGEVDPNKQVNRTRVIVALVIGLFVFIFVCWLLGATHNIMQQTHQKDYSLLSKGIDFNKAAFAGLHFYHSGLSAYQIFECLVTSLIIGGLLSNRINYATKKVAYGQKGNSRFTTVKELEDTYVMVPDHMQKGYPEKRASFPGYGGFPVAHLYRGIFRKKGYYFLDTGTTHNIIVGTSRSGKGETTIIEMIDLLSRASKKSSLVLNDPKGELYAASAETLRKRGYDVYLLNMEDGNKGMAFNPLQLIIKSWQQGNVEEALQLINTLTYTLYFDKNAGQNKWVNDGAQSAVNGMIIALIGYCLNPDNFDDHKAHPEKITLYNVSDMVNQLGAVDYSKDPEDPFTKSNVLSEYFKHLKQGSIAKKEFGSTSFSGEKAKGSIFSTIVQKLEIFTLKKNAKMTSDNTIELKSIGFPKYLSMKLLDSSLEGKLVNLFFKSKNGSVKSKYSMRINVGGFLEYNFDTKLRNGDFFEIRSKDGKKKARFKLKFKSKEKEVELIPEQRNTIKVASAKMNYSDKPTAIFMKIPDYNPSNNVLASIFINQLYTELARQCSFVAGHKTINRVSIILDEFGNMIPLQNMDGIMTVSAGRNILFTLVIQSYAQLFSKYGKEDGQVIKENCQNLCLIKSTDEGTNKEFSEACGMKTIESNNISRSILNTTQNINVSAEAVPLINTDRVRNLGEGERLILRPLVRKNRWGWRINAYPIFNTDKTLMPYAYTFLKDEFDTSNNPDLVEKPQPHARLNLDERLVDWSKWLTWTEPVKDDQGNVTNQNLALKAYNEYLKEDANKQEISATDSGKDEVVNSLEEFNNSLASEKIAKNNRIKVIVEEFINENREMLKHSTIRKLRELVEDDNVNQRDVIQVLYSDDNKGTKELAKILTDMFRKNDA